MINNRNHQNWQNKVIEQLASKYKLDKRVVDVIVHYPLLFTKHVMNDTKDDTPIRIRQLGVFAYRGSRTKRKFEQPKYEIVVQHSEELYDIHYNTIFETFDHFVQYIVDRFKEADYSAIRSVHKVFKEKIKYADRVKQ